MPPLPRPPRAHLDGLESDARGDRFIRIAWTAVQNATSYSLKIIETGGVEGHLENVISPISISSVLEGWSLKPATKYDIQLRYKVVSQAGTSESDYSDSFKMVTKPLRPTIGPEVLDPLVSNFLVLNWDLSGYPNLPNMLVCVGSSVDGIYPTTDLFVSSNRKDSWWDRNVSLSHSSVFYFLRTKVPEPLLTTGYNESDWSSPEVRFVSLMSISDFSDMTTNQLIRKLFIRNEYWR